MFTPGFYLGAEDLNAGPHDCVANTLPTEPFPLPISSHKVLLKLGRTQNEGPRRLNLVLEFGSLVLPGAKHTHYTSPSPCPLACHLAVEWHGW